MPSRSLSHLADEALLRNLATLVWKDRSTTADLLAHIAEVDARALYGPKGLGSMFLYCVGVLKLSPDVAAKRIQAARAAREFPVLLDAVEDGRLNVSAIVLLAPHLTPGNAGELVELAARQAKRDLQAILAHRFPRPDCAAKVAEPRASDRLALDAGAASPNQGSSVAERAAQQDPDPTTGRLRIRRCGAGDGSAFAAHRGGGARTRPARRTPRSRRLTRQRSARARQVPGPGQARWPRCRALP